MKIATFSVFEPDELEEEPDEHAAASEPTPATATDAAPALSRERRLS
ncbi:hypothetical protein [Streptomyces sp. NPDC005799]